MPNPWTEPAVEAVAKATVKMVGKARCLIVPDDWPLGAKVQMLLFPTPPPARAPLAGGAPPQPTNGHLKNP